MQKEYKTKSGFVAIMGRPNVGKSTLMNALVGEKVAIVSPKPQTTRNRILGVATGEGYQLVFVDTPGLHTPRTKLGDYMVKSAQEALKGVDALLCVVEAGGLLAADREILTNLSTQNVPRLVIVNKIDDAPREILMKTLSSLEHYAFEDIVPISARTGEGLLHLRDVLVQKMPLGPQYFPEDMITDQPERLIVAEIIREKALHNLFEEIPHGVGVDIMGMEKIREDMIKIDATILCEKASHKGMIIGKQGSMLKKIGQQARLDIEALLGSRVNLQLWVKVKEDWRNQISTLKELGYE